MPDALSCSGFQDPHVLHLPGDWASIRDSGELRTAIIQGVQPPRLFLKLPRQILFFASPLPCCEVPSASSSHSVQAETSRFLKR